MRNLQKCKPRKICWVGFPDAKALSTVSGLQVEVGLSTLTPHEGVRCSGHIRVSFPGIFHKSMYCHTT